MFRNNLTRFVCPCALVAWVSFFSTTVVADSVVFRLETTDVDGNPIDSVAVGNDFMLRGTVQDVREDNADGVFAAYLDVLFADELVLPTAKITYGDEYQNFQTSEEEVFANEGILDEIGAFSGPSVLGSQEYMLFEVPMEALRVGEVTFTTDPADSSPFHDVLLYNQNDPLPDREISFMSQTINVVPEPVGHVGLVLVVLAMAACRRRM